MIVKRDKVHPIQNRNSRVHCPTLGASSTTFSHAGASRRRLSSVGWARKRGSGLGPGCGPGVGVVDLDSDIFSWLPESPEGNDRAVHSCQVLFPAPRSLSWWYPFVGGAVSSTAPSTERNLVSARRIEGVEVACL